MGLSDLLGEVKCTKLESMERTKISKIVHFSIPPPPRHRMVLDSAYRWAVENSKVRGDHGLSIPYATFKPP